MPTSPDQEPRPVDIIFNCVICNAILPDVYKNAAMDKGFRDAENRDYQEPVTKMWLSECTHFFCGKHLEGGGVPFHKQGEIPRASCPACFSTKGDQSKKALYAVRGVGKGQYDERIPPNWFDTPPVALTTEGKGMDAMRFHYLSLVRFGCHEVVRRQEAERTADEALKTATQEGERVRALAEQADGLHERVKELEKCEKELKQWKERETEIKRCLNAFTEVQRENEKLREQLTAMGYAVPNRSCSANGEPLQDEEASRTARGAETSPQQRDVRTAGIPQNPESFAPQNPGAFNYSPSNRTLSGDATAPIANLHAGIVSRQSINRGKRPHVADIDSNAQRPSKSPKFVRAPSTELMPPPPVPFRRPPETTAMTNLNGATRNEAPPLAPTIQSPRQPVRGESNAFTQYDAGSHQVQSCSSPRRPPSRDQWLHEHSRPQRNTQDEPVHSFTPIQAFNNSSTRELTSRHFQQSQPLFTQSSARTPAPPRFADAMSSSLRGGDNSQHLPSAFPSLNQYAHTHTPRGPRQHFSPAIHRTGAGPGSSLRHHEHQLPSTPSPRKQMVPAQTSVASPFFHRTGALQHNGRVTLPDRSERPHFSPQNHNYFRSPSGRHFQQLDTGAPYPARHQQIQDAYGPASRQGINLFMRQINPLPPTTPSMRSSFQSGYSQIYNNHFAHSHHASQFTQPGNTSASSAGWGPPIKTVLSNSGHRSGASRASNEWRKEQRLGQTSQSQPPDMHLGHFLDAWGTGTGASAVQNQLGRRSVVRR